jgi:histidinol-phosphate aminotransferase
MIDFAAAALGDEAFIRDSYELNCRGMAQITEGLDRLGREHIPAYCKFVTFAVPIASELFRQLLRQGVARDEAEPAGAGGVA